MAENYKIAGVPLPENIDKPDDAHHDKLIWKLDCAVIEFIHQNILEQYNKNIEDDRYSDTKVFDSTRGVFTEGGLAFTGSGLLEKSHIQIYIRNMNCIKGLFIPREEIAFP